jgi:hypothetical protein
LKLNDVNVEFSDIDALNLTALKGKNASFTFEFS